MDTADIEEKAAQKAQTPKPDPFETDARREIRGYKPQTKKEREERQRKNREESPDFQKETQKNYPKGRPATLRDRILSSSIGRNVRFDLQRGPCIKGKLLDIDLEIGTCMIQGPNRSPPTILFVALKHIVRLEIYPD